MASSMAGSLVGTSVSAAVTSFPNISESSDWQRSCGRSHKHAEGLHGLISSCPSLRGSLCRSSGRVPVTSGVLSWQSFAVQHTSSVAGRTPVGSTIQRSSSIQSWSSHPRGFISASGSHARGPISASISDSAITETPELHASVVAKSSEEEQEVPVPEAGSGGPDGSTEGKKKVVVVGAGWAGLGACHHLAKQGFDVTLLEAGPQPGGLVAGWKTDAGRSVEVGIHGFWYPYRNIFALVDELGLKPFTEWTKSAQYSPAGLEVESPIFQDMPRLPSPLGTFVYTQFKRLPLADRLTALPLMYNVVDFDNSPEAWMKYDKMTARELFRQAGCTDRLYREAFNPMLLVGLFAPGEQCSAAATLGMLYYFILAHQPDFDVVWARGTVGAMIFSPWVEYIEQQGGRFLSRRRATDLTVDGKGAVTGVVCGDEVFPADAVVLAVSISGLQNIVAGSSVLKQRTEFVNTANLSAVDVLAVRLWLDRQIPIPKPSNACFGFDETTGWTFFDLNSMHDEYRDEPGTVVEADFYHANQFLPLTDDQVVTRVLKDLALCIPEFAGAAVVDRVVVRARRAVTHFFPGSYQYLMGGTTSFPNVFMAGDWIKTQHGSWSQEKAFVTGLEAANQVVAHLQQGKPAQIIPVETDEPHVVELRRANKEAQKLLKSLPFSQFFL